MDSTNKTTAQTAKAKKTGAKKWRYVFWNLLAMILFVAACIVGTIFALNSYTHHGDECTVPDVKNMTTKQASDKLRAEGFVPEISDSVYIKDKPAGIVYDQSILAGSIIKHGRTVLLTINSGTPPKLVLPDIADNSSLREATMRLKAQGFKVGPEKYIPGEKDWVYEVRADGKNVVSGSRISINQTITLVVGDGSLYTDEDGNSFDPDTMSLDEPFIVE